MKRSGEGLKTVTAGIITLTTSQIDDFLRDPLDGMGPCQMSETLPWTALATTGVVPGARILMAELEGKGAKLTGQGNLNRKLVEKLMDHWPDDEAAEVRSISKVVNEWDFNPAMYLHAVLRVARLVRHEKGYLKLTRKGRALLPEDAAGRLQALLFRTTFTRFNLAYLDRWDEPNPFKPQISLILYLMAQVFTDWRSVDALLRTVTIPMVNKLDSRPLSRPESFFELRVLRYLCWFGLVEQAAHANDDFFASRLYRRTPLYDRTLSFVLS